MMHATHCSIRRTVAPARTHRAHTDSSSRRQMASGKVFIDVVIDDELVLAAIAHGTQCTLSRIDSEIPLLQVLPSLLLEHPRDCHSCITRAAGWHQNALWHMEIHSKYHTPSQFPPSFHRLPTQPPPSPQAGTHLFIAPTDGSFFASAAKSLHFSNI